MPTQQLDPVRPLATDAAIRAADVTLACFRHRPLLAEEARRRELASVLDDVLPRHGLALAAYAFLPHQARLLLTWPADRRPRLPWILFVIKRRSELLARDAMQAGGVALPRALVERAGRGRYVYRFWEPGPPPTVPIPPDDLPAAIRAMHQTPAVLGYCADPVAWRWSSRRCYHIPESPATPSRRRCHIPHAAANRLRHASRHRATPR